MAALVTDVTKENKMSKLRWLSKEIADKTFKVMLALEQKHSQALEKELAEQRKKYKVKWLHKN